MAIGDIWELTLRGTYQGQEILNVFGYVETVALGGDVAGADVAKWLWDTIGTDLLAMTVDGVEYGQVDALQVTGGVAIGSYTIASGSGDRTVEGLPSFATFSFRYNRASQASRHGYKRFAGVSEDWVSGNTNSFPSVQTNALIAALESDIFDSSSVLDGRLEPCIISRVVNGQERPVPLAFPVSSIVFIGVTTQNTRKP